MSCGAVERNSIRSWGNLNNWRYRADGPRSNVPKPWTQSISLGRSQVAGEGPADGFPGWEVACLLDLQVDWGAAGVLACVLLIVTEPWPLTATWYMC